MGSDASSMGIFDAGREHAPGKRCFASIRDGKLLFSFFGSDLWAESRHLKPGKFVHVAFTFNAHRGKSIFVNGKLESSDKNRHWCTARGPAKLGGNGYDGPFFGMMRGAVVLLEDVGAKDLKGIMKATKAAGM